MSFDGTNSGQILIIKAVTLEILIIFETERSDTVVGTGRYSYKYYAEMQYLYSVFDINYKDFINIPISFALEPTKIVY